MVEVLATMDMQRAVAMRQDLHDTMTMNDRTPVGAAELREEAKSEK